MVKYQIVPNVIKINVLIILMLINYIDCNHISKNNSDVIITYEAHAEANVVRKPISIPNIESTSSTDEYLDSEKGVKMTPIYEENTEDVVFIPNEKEVRRIEDEIERDYVNVGKLMNAKKVADTEKPNKDILFISGKNNENVETKTKKERNLPKHSEVRSDRKAADFKPKVVMSCKNLDCNNSVDSVCGGKVEHKKWRYRLFLNECFFRKVNCGFNYAENRYREVSLANCQNIGAHLNYRPYVYSPVHVTPSTPEAPEVNIRRSFPSRRALNKAINGSFCSHLCPVFCPDDYNPECALSNTGQRKVFVNHCKLDYNSCLYGVVWHRRPLSECVGGKKADLRQNRGFISLMQKAGIVNEKGRLMLNK